MLSGDEIEMGLAVGAHLGLKIVVRFGVDRLDGMHVTIRLCVRQTTWSVHIMRLGIDRLYGLCASRGLVLTGYMVCTYVEDWYRQA